METKTYSLELGGKILTAEFNNLADQANGSVIVKSGGTVVLATAVISKYSKDNFDFFPLTVDFEEKFYAAGKILGGRYFRREGRPTDEAILSGRIVDRTIRPLFEDHIRHEVQVTIIVLSLGEDDPDVLAVIAASLALGTSNIPWQGPTSAVRIGKNKESQSLIINPTYEKRAREEFEVDVLACGKDQTLNMIETSAKEVNEEDLKPMLEKALKEIETIQEFQKKIIGEIGKEKLVVEKPARPAEMEKVFESEIGGKLKENIFGKESSPSSAGNKKIYELLDLWLKIFAEKIPETDINLAKTFFEEKVNELVHHEAIENERRPDRRKISELRPLYTQAGKVSEMLHGSGIFFRGGTHVFSILTLGGPGDSQIIDGMETQTKKRFMHHYNFPPFSVGETGRMGGTNRRMIGHGALAEKALLPVLPSKEDFPYTIRVVSECLASNGSTSMGAVCASTLSLMDGGVPIKNPVAGIAIGLMIAKQPSNLLQTNADHAQKDSENKNLRYKLLTDIQGPEDHYGDMDFKVAGTRQGVTAIQMDVKVSGVSLQILLEALQKGKAAREQILARIEKEISAPREKISENAPEIVIVKIKPSQIGLIIGSGGKIINQIKETTETEIDIEDDGSVFITGKNGGASKAAEIVREITKEYKPGEKYIGEIVKIVDFGVFVKIGTNTEGLLHISEAAPIRIERLDKIFALGEKIPVIIKEIDEKDRIKLSLKDVDPEYIKNKFNNARGNRT